MTRTHGSMRRSPRRVFRDRREAGRVLADLLGAYRGRKGVAVLGLARGGVPVAWEVAAALGAPLDAFIVRKLGAPGHEELAMGALASGGRVVVNDDVMRALRVSPQQLRDVAEREGRELIRREAAYRGGRPPVDVAGKTVILVDDGLATGASMFAAVQALREAEPAQIVIAVPAAPESTCREFADLVDDVVCATMPTPFLAVGESFWDFKQVSDEEVRDYLATPTVGPATATIRIKETPAEMIDRAAVDAPAGVPPTEALEEIIGDARIVLIGESSHGTQEFYEARAAITKWLIDEKGFCAVAAEADWPDAYRVDRDVRGLGSDGSADDALSGFERFPPGCGATPWSEISLTGCTSITNVVESPADARRASTALTSTALHRSMQGSYLLSREGRSPCGGAGAGPLRVFRPHLRRRRAGLRVRGGFRRRLVLRTPGNRSTGRDAVQSTGLRVSRWPARRRRGVLRPAECADGPQCGGLLPCDVRRSRHVMEPARPAHGPGVARSDGPHGPPRRLRTGPDCLVGEQFSCRRCPIDRGGY